MSSAPELPTESPAAAAPKGAPSGAAPPAVSLQPRRGCASLLIEPTSATIVAADDEARRLLGLPAGVTLPVTLDSAMPAVQRLRALAHAGTSCGPRRETLVLWTASGALPLRCEVAAQDLPGGRPALLVRAALDQRPATPPCARDAAPTPAIAETPEDMRTRELQARLAHELRTPLSAIIAYAEVLKSEHFGPLADARYRDYAGHVFDSARHALNVVDSMLHRHASRTGAPELVFTDVDPREVVERCLAVARPLAEHAGLTLEAACTPRLPRVVADEVSLRQILLNLLSNAIKFAHRGDRVTVAIACTGSGGLDISVIDTGPGMDAAARGRMNGNGAHAANATHAPDGAKTGLGLGLPLTKALAEANGATLAIASSADTGTRVTVSFAKDRLVPV